MKQEIREKTIREIEDLILSINDTDNKLYSDYNKETEGKNLDDTNRYYDENYAKTRNILMDAIKNLTIYAYNLKNEK